MKVIYILYILIIIGAFIFGYDYTKLLVLSLKQKLNFKKKIKLRRYRESFSDDRQNNLTLKFIKHIEKLIKVNRNQDIKEGIKGFFLVTITIFIIMFLGLGFVVGIIEALIYSILFAFLPYAVIRIRLENKRSKGSKEGYLLVSEISNNYKIENYNMKEAINKTILNIDSDYISKNSLIDLSMRINKCKNKDEFKEVIGIFIYSFNTAWSRILGNNMLFALCDGVRVDKSLDDLSKMLLASKKIEERKKRENFDSTLIIKYFIPLMYILSIFVANKYFGFTLGKFLKLQFLNPLGLRWFIISLLCYIFGIIVIKVVTDEKMDV